MPDLTAPLALWRWIGLHAGPLFLLIYLAWTICLILLAFRLHFLSRAITQLKRYSEQRFCALQKLETALNAQSMAMAGLSGAVRQLEKLSPKPDLFSSTESLRSEIELLVLDFGSLDYSKMNDPDADREPS